MLILLVFFTSNCSNVRTNENFKDKRIEVDKFQTSDKEHYIEQENEVINKTLQLVLDSLAKQIQLIINSDIKNLHSIYYLDSLVNTRYSFEDIKHLFINCKIDLDTIYINKGKSKLNLIGTYLKGNIELLPLSIRRVEDMGIVNNNKSILLIYTRVNFNKEKTLGFFNLNLLCSFNVGYEYAVFIVKVNDKWVIKRIIESAII
jgi:hypothetical protein